MRILSGHSPLQSDTGMVRIHISQIESGMVMHREIDTDAKLIDYVTKCCDFQEMKSEQNMKLCHSPGGGTLKIFLTPCSFHVFENTPLMSQKQGLPGAFLPPFHRKNKD